MTTNQWVAAAHSDHVCAVARFSDALGFRHTSWSAPVADFRRIAKLFAGIRGSNGSAEPGRPMSKPIRGLLIRVGADQTEGGGCWNGPVDSRNWSFAYVPIPETGKIRRGLQKPYSLIQTALAPFVVSLPTGLHGQTMHLDPDFAQLTYGDQGQRSQQITSKLKTGDILVFYAGLRDAQSDHLVYAIIGLYVLRKIELAVRVPQARWDQNAHTRRLLPANATDIVITAKRGVSGRLAQCLPIGEFRDRAYRIVKPLLREWGGISSRDGYLQRSARLPELLDAQRFYSWFLRQSPTLSAKNN